MKCGYSISPAHVRPKQKGKINRWRKESWEKIERQSISVHCERSSSSKYIFIDSCTAGDGSYKNNNNKIAAIRNISHLCTLHKHMCVCVCLCMNDVRSCFVKETSTRWRLITRVILHGVLTQFSLYFCSFVS